MNELPLTGFWQEQLRKWQATEQLEQILPEVAALRGVPQPAKYHSEGDAFTHTLMAVDAIAEDADGRVFWAVLLHDIGKVSTTQFVNGRWRSHGHSKVGAGQVCKVMGRFQLDKFADDVAWLVRHHDFILDWGAPGERLSKRQQKFCEHFLFDLLIEVCRADSDGSQGFSSKRDWLERVILLVRQTGDG